MTPPTRPERTGHTPTPWRIEAPDHAIVANRPDGSGLPLCLGRVYRPIHYGNQRDIDAMLANGRLIVRAVNAHDAMRDALEEILQANEMSHGSNRVHFKESERAWVNAIEAARAALRLAEGDTEAK